MVKNREWEKIFDILDQGMIEKIFNPNTWVKKLSYLVSDCPKPFPDTLKVFMDGVSWQNCVLVQSLKINWEFSPKKNLNNP